MDVRLYQSLSIVALTNCKSIALIFSLRTDPRYLEVTP